MNFGKFIFESKVYFWVSLVVASVMLATLGSMYLSRLAYLQQGAKNTQEMECDPEKPETCLVDDRNLKPLSWQDMSDWKIYNNDEYGFEFKYPGDWDWELGSEIDSKLLLVYLYNQYNSGFIFSVQSFSDNLAGYLNELRQKDIILSFEYHPFLTSPAYLVETHCLGPCTEIIIEKNGYLYSIGLPPYITVENFKFLATSDDPILNQILSTFRFTK